MRHNLALALLLLGSGGICTSVQAQPAGAAAPVPDAATVAPPPTRYPTGATPLSPEEYAALPKLGTFRAWRPRHVDLSPMFPLPGNQYPKPDCTAWATAYSGLGYLRGLTLGHRVALATEQPSPVYVYNRLRPNGSSCTVPTRVIDALKLLKNEGTATFADFPDNPNICNDPAPQSLVSGSTDQKLGGWSAISRENARDPQSPVVLDDIRGALFRQQPVVFTMPAPDDFMTFKGSAAYTHSRHEDSNLHAMTLVGYDDDRQAFRVINSWGKDWGDQGYVWIDYDTFTRLAGEAYALQGLHDVPPTPEQAGNLTPRQALDARMASLPCGTARLGEKGPHPVLSGFAGDEDALDGLHKALLAVDPDAKWDMDYHPWPQCEAETTLAAAFAVGGVKLVAQTETGAARTGDPVLMNAGDKFGLSAQTTAARPWLTVVYLQNDGSAVTLYQGQAPVGRRGLRQVGIGTGGSGQVQFQVGAPFGPEMIIAIASATPLFGTELESYATERQFLTGLNTRLTRAQPGTVAAAALRIRTRG
ncbi:C1 family peptidase [Novosphingobium sp.]|uniref:C1 family peptidase n=1 Tax=Novosphingobium sp. TaxID=1874826 RepID=UPI0033408641